LNKKVSVNYIGDDEYLDPDQVDLAAEKVIKKHWKLPGSPPEEFKVDINIVTDPEIKEINREYLNKDRPTDVISFSLMEGEEIPVEEKPLIGQVIISKDAARRQAAEYNHSVEDEMLILVIHGLLHVAGWEEGKEIQKCQETIKDQIQAQT
jgi:probable rRNA maturation factor